MATQTLRTKYVLKDPNKVRVQTDLSRAELWQLIGLLTQTDPPSPASVHHELLTDLQTIRADLGWEDSWIDPPRDE